MKVIRSLIFSIGMLVSIPVAAVLLVASAPLPRRYHFRVATGWARFVLAWLRLVCGIRYRVEGLEHIYREPAVILSKHQSTWETLALQVVFQPVTWVAKRELMWVPFFGWGLALLRPIAIDRSAGRKAMEQIVVQGGERLRSGISVVVFPEGTRTPPGTRRRYRLGGAVLAVEAGYPVVPVAHNAGYHWGRRALLKHPGEIIMRIGEPISSEGKTAEQLIRQVEEWVEGAVEEISGSATVINQESRPN